MGKRKCSGKQCSNKLPYQGQELRGAAAGD
jgi:hypothetical protein